MGEAGLETTIRTAHRLEDLVQRELVDRERPIIVYLPELHQRGAVDDLLARSTRFGSTRNGAVRK